MYGANRGFAIRSAPFVGVANEGSLDATKGVQGRRNVEEFKYAS